MRVKRILVVSQYFYPEEFRINDICKEWIKRGYQVTVVTGIPNYPKGKFFHGYGWFRRRREVWQGIKIIRLPIVPRGNNKPSLILNYMSFVISGFIWKTLTSLKVDCVFNFAVSPMTQALVGVWFAKRRKIPCYLYVQDLWPDNVEVVTGIHNPAILKSIGKMVDYIYTRCDRILSASPSFVSDIQARVEDQADRIHYWPQYAEEFYQPVDKPTKYPELDNQYFKVVFTGNIGKAQGLDILLDAAEQIHHRKDLMENFIRFIIVGDGRERKALIQEINNRGLKDYFIMTDRMPPEEIPHYLANCDAAFISFMDNELFAKTIPAKLQSYMACAMPIIASACGETERIIKEAQCGYCSGLGDAHELVQNIVHMYKNKDRVLMGERGKYYSEVYFNKQKLMDEMDTWFVNVN